jgi:hypothetical protein
MDYGTIDRWYNGLPPLIICDTATFTLGNGDRWYAGLPSVIGADEYVAPAATGIMDDSRGVLRGMILGESRGMQRMMN